MTRWRWSTDEEIEEERRKDERNADLVVESAKDAPGCLAGGCLPSLTPVFLGLSLVPWSLIG